uniref:Uncharacterized protein n=1 Tax=Cacopsylla melanoneura TaxID=428564 RepID=A0A8D9E7U1_9HEMI
MINRVIKWISNFNRVINWIRSFNRLINWSSNTSRVTMWSSIVSRDVNWSNIVSSDAKGRSTVNRVAKCSETNSERFTVTLHVNADNGEVSERMNSHYSPLQCEEYNIQEHHTVCRLYSVIYRQPQQEWQLFVRVRFLL